MDRQAFLDAQLWLRRLDPEEFEWPSLEIASTRTVHRILPRAYRSEGENSVLTTEGICWGSFEVDGKFCFFRVDNDNEDQTQMQVELLYAYLEQSASEKVVLVRFELEATLAQSGAESTQCVSSRWQSWDHYLQQTETTFTQIGERTRVCSPQAGQNAPSSHADAIQLAAEAFNQSFLGADASRSSKIALDKATQALRSYESLAFSQLFPPQRSFNPAKKRRTKSTDQISPADAENMWNFLLESRRALLRQELTVACLPHKKGSVTTRPSS
ncbi:hypothetical protein Poli38472_011611 [Pythium oligandrum]|uniref:Uncharacterized protein n=1 Tax=Pythium oligandrum TaxID=41045 RepID=A0A8K1CJF6_PYTOL|nr:hypothetical protein Poli38472_011611 [Pythium oligandrum]|eukprot:TMW64731.1 hypothetical protein Poli38472_011611 [Pythium oligandrum]